MQRSSIIAATTAIAILLVGLQYWNGSRPKPDVLPALARDLPKDTKAADRVFQQRVAQRFPAGTPAAALETELKAQGFGIESSAGWHTASLKRKLFPCEIIWRVRWRAAAGKVSETDASYGTACP